MPGDPAGRARSDMLCLAAGAYFYPAAVMGTFFHDVYIRANGGTPDLTRAAEAADRVEPVLAAFEAALSGPWLLGTAFTLADAVLAPMLGNFAMSAIGRDRVDRHPKLGSWLGRAEARPSVLATAVPVPTFGLPG